MGPETGAEAAVDRDTVDLAHQNAGVWQAGIAEGSYVADCVDGFGDVVAAAGRNTAAAAAERVVGGRAAGMGLEGQLEVRPGSQTGVRRAAGRQLPGAGRGCTEAAVAVGVGEVGRQGEVVGSAAVVVFAVAVVASSRHTHSLHRAGLDQQDEQRRRRRRRQQRPVVSVTRSTVRCTR